MHRFIVVRTDESFSQKHGIKIDQQEHDENCTGGAINDVKKTK